MKLLYALLSPLLLLTACQQQYVIDGNSSVSCLDGRMLYLRLTDDGNEEGAVVSSVCLDSCKMVHGRFSFSGEIDTVRMALLYSEQHCVMPIVLENGNLSIEVNNLRQRVTGGPLNDRLYDFFRKRNRFDNELWELQHKAISMMHEGKDAAEVERKLGKRMAKLKKDTEDLETKFVRDNFENALGPGFFMLLCSQYPTPILTPQIRRIVDGAPPSFLGHPFVNRYVRLARARFARYGEEKMP